MALPTCPPPPTPTPGGALTLLLAPALLRYNRISKVRAEELRWIRGSSMYRALNYFLIAANPIIGTVLTFLIFTAAGNVLTPQKAFVALSLFNVLRMPLFMLPQIIDQVRSTCATQRKGIRAHIRL